MTLKSAVFTRESLADSRQNRNQSFQKVTASRSEPTGEAMAALAAFLYAVIPKETEDDGHE